MYWIRWFSILKRCYQINLSYCSPYIFYQLEFRPWAGAVFLFERFNSGVAVLKMNFFSFAQIHNWNVPKRALRKTWGQRRPPRKQNNTNENYWDWEKRRRSHRTFKSNNGPKFYLSICAAICELQSQVPVENNQFSKLKVARPSDSMFIILLLPK